MVKEVALFDNFGIINEWHRYKFEIDISDKEY